ncbi:hypothetical protein KsCSTR_06220 [Candidatus Kuenenia stuttgartiensis]|uniref:DUF3782 domain-containing protein n=1 Tax=Kuenenia stuttgartiensis TaxID=174633 RepID=A0A6G7GKQ3_KUEST|nr:DUF3782 domain-containing protein [Candidatus Kuenenia stuttgartiensis]QII10001.1 hypothetical protein KsCSTR_06220 [Candidatus Kuenenia stuttgartiensis]
MKTKEIREIILKELPDIIKHDKEIQDFILHLSKECFADKNTTEDRFDKILRELAEDRETQNRKWLEDTNRWWEQAEKWKEQDKRWQEQTEKWKEQDKRWQEQAERWDKQESKWRENQKVIRDIMESIKKMDRKYDSTIGALGARWGLRTEQSFRNALKGILRDVSGLDVINVIEYDEEGIIFGRPEQIELDLVIKNGHFMICEIKLSISKSDMYIFQKKADFYQKKHNRKARRLIVISPMVDKKAMEFAKDAGILVYSYVEDIEPEIFSI